MPRIYGTNLKEFPGVCKTGLAIGDPDVLGEIFSGEPEKLSLHRRSPGIKLYAFSSVATTQPQCRSSGSFNGRGDGELLSPHP